jgi:DNA polymerase-1
VGKTLALGHVSGVRTVYIFQEPNASGQAFAAAVPKELAKLGWSGQALVVTLDNVKDPSELHQRYPEEFKEWFRQALDAAVPVAVRSAADAVLRLADVAVLPVEWEWERYIPRGCITLVDGDPDRGKSFVALDLAARRTRGWKPPPGGGPGDRAPGNVLIMNAEDDLARTIKPRLLAMGADMTRVFALPDLPDGEHRRPPVLPDDLVLIERLVMQFKVELLIIDPLMAFISDKVDSHKDSDIRRTLHRVKLLAERTQAAVLVIRHLNKLVSVSEPLYRGGGSIGIIGAARSALLVGKHPDEPRIRVLCRAKSNLSVEPPSLAYTIEPHEDSARVAWLGETDFTAEDLLARPPARRGAKGEEREDASSFLKEQLGNGPREQEEIKAAAQAQSIAERTLFRAKKELKVRSFKVGFQDAKWYWALPNDDRDPEGPAPHDHAPEDCHEAPEDCQNSHHKNNLATFGENAPETQEKREDCHIGTSGNLRGSGNLREQGPAVRLDQVPAEDCHAATEDGHIAEDGHIPVSGNLRKNIGKTADSPEDCQIVCVAGNVAIFEGRYHILRDGSGLPAVLQALEETEVVGLDVETTGLSPRTDRVRLLTLQAGRGLWLVDCFVLDPQPLFPALAQKTLVAHNAAFDMAMLAALGFTPGRAVCTMVLSQLVHGTRRPRGFHNLAQCLQRELGYTLDKDKQRSDWSGELSRDQLDYAARDAAVLVPLYERLTQQVKETGQQKIAELESRCLPAMVWLAHSGVALAADAWKALAADAEQESTRLAQELDAAAPRPEQGGLYSSGRNWDSPEQVKAAFKALGIELASTADDALAKVAHPLADLVRRYRAASKRASTYGEDWLKHLSGDGRVYAGWRQVGADSGRMACREPNLQNLPRGEAYRRCFVAPSGRVLVKADFSQIELRIAAKVSGDRSMLDAYRRGQDLHTLTAQRVLGIRAVTKEDRQLAKALNFGLLYGMGVKGFQVYARSNYGVDLSEAQAREYRQAFFAAYPGLARWHNTVRQKHAAETRTLAGRRRVLAVKDPDTLRLNSPVQGSGADGLKLALALLWERRDQCPGAFPVLAVHDEVVVECDADQADAAAAWLKQAMLDGMAPLIEPVPVEVEVTVAPTWGG